ncbi:hypothetical protein [Luteolibacter luteus]|uniref:Copper chaperone PCu(A)C n=1 Tax=Luteolibacter luteus TaxID=2728835 RepID=A0A858RH64_9BACT|nr:hypothetical protein [Luteolibacter luteus]QJE95911.1 hypothetical protein HHL09_08995 [Luteolibacter luteus]
MKPNLLILLALLGAPLAFAEDKHDHSKETKEEHAAHDHDHDDHDEDEHDHGKKGPNGGMIVDSVTPAIEVSVDKGRKARIVFLDKESKAVDLEKQVVTGTSGERSNPVKLTFTAGKDKDANVLISDKALPEGAHVPMILVIKATPDAKAVTARFELHLH